MRNASRYRDIPQAVLSLRANKLGFRATVSPVWTALEPLSMREEREHRGRSSPTLSLRRVEQRHGGIDHHLDQARAVMRQRALQRACQFG